MPSYDTDVPYAVAECDVDLCDTGVSLPRRRLLRRYLPHSLITLSFESERTFVNVAVGKKARMAPSGRRNGRTPRMLTDHVTTVGLGLKTSLSKIRVIGRQTWQRID